MTGRVSNLELERWQGTRLEIYRLAVQAGFFNEGPATVAYKGYHIIPIPEEKVYLIMQGGIYLMRVSSMHIAKIWVTCRVHGVNIIEANAIIKQEA